MVINDGCDHVRFVSYDGKHPNLCQGTLVLNIDGKDITFAPDKKRINNVTVFPTFWSTGGSKGFHGPGYSNPYTTSGEWVIYKEDLPEQYRQYVSEIDEVFNDNVPFGCCGGCL